MIRNRHTHLRSPFAIMATLASAALWHPCLAQGSTGTGPTAAPAAAATTLQDIKEQLSELDRRLRSIQEEIEAPPKAFKMEKREQPAPKSLAEKLRAIRDDLNEIESEDTTQLLAPPETGAPESGVERLQRHQRELTTQKLGDQLIILDENP